MKPKTIKTLYWIFTVLFLLAMLGDAYGGITMQQAGKDSLAKLGYPFYLMVIMGAAKIAGVLAIAIFLYAIKSISERSFGRPFVIIRSR